MRSDHKDVGMDFLKNDFVRKINNPGKSGQIAGPVVDDAGDRVWPVRLPNGSINKWMEGTFEHVPDQETILALLRKGSFGKKADFS